MPESFTGSHVPLRAGDGFPNAKRAGVPIKTSTKHSLQMIVLEEDTVKHSLQMIPGGPEEGTHLANEVVLSHDGQRNESSANALPTYCAARHQGWHQQPRELKFYIFGPQRSSEIQKTKTLKKRSAAVESNPATKR